MPAKHFYVAKSADKNFLKLLRNIQTRIIDAYTRLKDNPLSGEKLHGELAGKYKLRIGDYRLVYEFDSKESRIKVVKIEHRQGIYK